MARIPKLTCAVLLACAMPAVAQVPRNAPADRTIVIRGCVTPADDNRPAVNRSLLVWSRDDVMLADVVTEMTAAKGSPNGQPDAVGTAGSTQTVFYWLQDADNLKRYAGRRVEITGQLDKELKKGEFEIERKNNVTEIEFQTHDQEVKARVPAGFLGESGEKDVEYNVIVRDVDVKNVRVLSDSCASR